eukprot:75109-Rhodomonas_salina.1
MLRWATSIILLHTLALIGRYRTGIWLIPGTETGQTTPGFSTRQYRNGPGFLTRQYYRRSVR